MITKERLQEIMEYNSGTGKFRYSKAALYGRAGSRRQGQPEWFIGSINSSGYARIMIDGKLYLAHRLAWLYVHGYMPTEIDHINRVRIDNRMLNLRQATSSINKINSTLRSNNTSGYRGIYWNERYNCWTAEIKKDKKLTRKFFTLKEEAAMWRRKMEEELLGSSILEDL